MITLRVTLALAVLLAVAGITTAVLLELVLGGTQCVDTVNGLVCR